MRLALVRAWGLDTRGAAAPIAAVAMVGLVGLSALVTDVGAWYARRGALQSAADAAAMAAAGKASPTTVAGQVMALNGFSASDLVSVEPGYYCADASLAAPARFSLTACATGSVTPSSPNAARVTATSTAPLLFSGVLLSGAKTLRVRAVGTRIDEAGINIGSGVASVDPALANAVLSSFLGSNLSLSAAQYQALAQVDISAGEFLDVLAAQVGATGTYANLVSMSVKQKDVLQAAATVANAHGSSVAGGALSDIRSRVAGDPSIPLGKLFSLGVWSKVPINASDNQGALKAGIDLHQLAIFSAQLAGASHAVAISSSLGLPGVAGVTLDATAVEPPAGSYFAFGPTGISVHTAQVRSKLTLDLVTASLPLYIEAASGDAAISSISCGDQPSTDARVQVQARSGLATVFLGEVPTGLMTNFSRPLTYADVTPVYLLRVLGNTVSISVRSQLALGAGNWTTVTFVQPGQGGGDGTIGAPLSGAGAYSAAGYARVVSNGFLSSLLPSLIGNLSLTATLAGVPITVPGGALASVTSLLSPILSGLDPIVDQLLAANGIGLGYLDVSATGVRCGVSATVA